MRHIKLGNPGTTKKKSLTEKLVTLVRKGVIPPEDVEQVGEMVKIRHESQLAMLSKPAFDAMMGQGSRGPRIIMTEPLWKIVARPIGDGGDE